MCQNIKFGINMDNFDPQSRGLNILPSNLEKHYLSVLEDDTLFISFEELGITEEQVNDPQYYVRVGGIDDIEHGDNIEFAATKIINLYRYISDEYGSSNIGANSRDFCRQLVNRSTLSMLPYQSIISLNSSNPGQGPNGSDTYSVFDWRGGARCKHYWVKYFYQQDTKNLVIAPKSEQPTQVGKGNVPNIPESKRREGWGTKK